MLDINKIAEIGETTEQQLWVVYIEDKGYEQSTSIECVVSDLEVFKKLAKEKYSEYYHLVAEPKKLIV